MSDYGRQLAFEQLEAIAKSARKSKASRRARQTTSTGPKAPQLVAGRPGRELRALEHGRPHIGPEEHIEATPPAAAVNHATTPASAARRLTSTHTKIGAAAAGIGAVGAGGYLVNRKIKAREKALVGKAGLNGPARARQLFEARDLQTGFRAPAVSKASLGPEKNAAKATLDRLAARRTAGFGFKTKTPQDAMPVKPKPSTLVPTGNAAPGVPTQRPGGTVTNQLRVADPNVKPNGFPQQRPA